MIYLYFVSMQAMHLFIIIIILLIVMFMLWTSFLNLHYGAFLVQQHPELTDWRIDTIQDFLCNLGMKPHMHLVEIGIFSLNHVIVRPTKIIKDLRKAST